jgi:hypothetical protein
MKRLYSPEKNFQELSYRIQSMNLKGVRFYGPSKRFLFKGFPNYLSGKSYHKPVVASATNYHRIAGIPQLYFLICLILK